MMQTGMLWYLQKADLIQGICDGAQYYAAKYGRTPNECHVNPADHEEGVSVVAGCQIIVSPHCQRRHLWLGFSDDGE